MGIFDRAAKGLTKGLERLFAKLKRGGSKRAQPHSPPPQAAKAPAHEAQQQSLDDRLQLMVETKSTGTVGAIHWIGLRKFHERYSDHWHRIGPKVHAVAENCIKRRLICADDIYERRGDDYAILFAQSDHRRAKLQCALIANDITEALLGEDGLAELIRVCSTAVELNRQEVRELRENGGISALLEREAERHETQLEEPRYEWVPLEEAMADIQCIYQPMWQARRGVVSSYRCYPACVTDAGSLIVGERVSAPLSALTGKTRPELAPALDRFVLNLALAGLNELVEANTKNVLVIPVHHLTLSSPAATADYIGACRKMPEGFDRLVVFEVIGIDGEADHINMFKPVMQIKPYCRAVILTQPANRRDFSRITLSGLHSVGMTLDHATEAEDQIVAKMERFVAAANRHRFRTYVHGIESLSLAEAAQKAGFDYISGMTTTSLSDAVTRPQGVYEVGLEQLFHGEVAKNAEAPPKSKDDALEVEFREETTKPLQEAAQGAPAPGASDTNEKLLLLTGQLMAEHKLSKADALILARARLDAGSTSSAA